MNTNKITKNTKKNKTNIIEETLKEFSFENVMLKNRGLSAQLPVKLNREIKNGTPVAKLLDTLCFFMIRTLQTMRKMEQYPGYTWENYKKYCSIIEPLIRELYNKYNAKTTIFIKQNLMNIADNIQLIIGMNTGMNTGVIYKNSGSKSKTLRRTNSSKNGGNGGNGGNRGNRGNGGNGGNTGINVGKYPVSANKLKNTTKKLTNNGRTMRLKRYNTINSGNFIGMNKLKRIAPKMRSNSNRK